MFKNFKNIFFTEHLRWLLLRTGIHGNTNFLREVRFYRVVGMIHGGAYFRGLRFEKLKYQARFKVIEAFTIKQPHPQSNFNKYSKKMHW